MASEICTLAALAANTCSSVGNAGKYMSTAIGANALNAPRMSSISIRFMFAPGITLRIPNQSVPKRSVALDFACRLIEQLGDGPHLGIR